MHRWQAMLILLLANALWGTAWPVAKLATAELPATAVAGYRLVAATLIFWAVILWRERGQVAALALGWGEAARIMLLGLVGLGVSYLLGYNGIALTRASDASLMIIGEVIFTALLAARLANDRLTLARVAGVALGGAGIVVLVFDSMAGGGSDGAARLLGNMLILAGLLFQALYSVLGTGYVRRHSPLLVNALLYTGTLILWGPALIWQVSQGDAWPSPVAALSILYLAAVCSVVCMLLWFAALRAFGAGFGAASLFLQPVVGTSLGVVALGEPLTAGLAGGGLLVLAALALITFEGGRPRL